MLQVGKERASKHKYINNIDWLHGDAQCLPLPSNSFDVYTIAFGMRNVVDVEKVGVSNIVRLLFIILFKVLLPTGAFALLYILLLKKT